MSTKSNAIFNTQPKICIFKQSDIVRSKADGLIVMVNVNSNLASNTFIGTVLKESAITRDSKEKLGYYSETWAKSSFLPFEGTIVLDSTFE